MSTPEPELDPLTVLAQRLDTFTSVLGDVAAASQGRDAQLRADFNELTGLVAEVAERLQSLQPPPEQPEEPKPARSWTQRATGRQWAELADWVDWLSANYRFGPTTEHALFPCWPYHPDAAEDLAALHTAWKAAMLADAKNTASGGEQALYWHDRYLYACLKRLKPSFGECMYGKHAAPGSPVGITTDRTDMPQPDPG
jgi:hypothetical protein